jgi:hypothetical protein
MRDWVKLIAVLTLVLHSIIGRHVAEHASHAHVLIGSVTPEQLRTHQAREEREGWSRALRYSSDHRVALDGGLIVSLLFGPDATHIPAVLDGTCLVIVLVSTISCAVSSPRLTRLSSVRSPLDPPPRFIFESAPLVLSPIAA